MKKLQNSNPVGLSRRSNKFATQAARIDLDLFMEASQNIYHKKKNPKGAFPLNVAENKVMSPIIQKKFMEIMATRKLPDWTMGYTGPTGNSEVLEILASFMAKHFGSQSISADTLCISAGASASLEVLSFALSNPGEVVIIPAPSYPMYTNDLGIKSGMVRYDLQSHVEIKGLSNVALADTDHLEKAEKEIKKAGKKLSMVLITSPDNPTGSVYTLEQLKKISKWCIERKVHLVVNEIYAFSGILPRKGKGKKWRSFAGIMQKEQSPYLHLVYALSKDFCISGFRFGIIHSLNRDFMKALGSINIPHMVSNVSQWLVGELFKNEKFIKQYLKVNEIQISKNYYTVTKTLDKLKIPYIPAKGSLFVWADFSKYLKKNTQNAEMEFWMKLFRKTGVLLTPGIGFQHEKFGLFRIVHTAVSLDHLKVAMKRLKKYLKS